MRTSNLRRRLVQERVPMGLIITCLSIVGTKLEKFRNSTKLQAGVFSFLAVVTAVPAFWLAAFGAVNTITIFSAFTNGCLVGYLIALGVIRLRSAALQFLLTIPAVALLTFFLLRPGFWKSLYMSEKPDLIAMSVWAVSFSMAVSLDALPPVLLLVVWVTRRVLEQLARVHLPG